MSSYVRATFRAVKLTAHKTVKCPSCGATVRRQRTFEMTLNPWNVNEHGTPRTPQECHEALRDKAKLWEAETERCSGCEAASHE